MIAPEALARPPRCTPPANGKCSTAHIVFFPRGRDAIHYLSQALGIGPGDCILVPALICRSAVEPIIATGAQVQFVEMAADLDYNEVLLEAAFSQYRPKAVLAVHHFGRRPRLERYRDLCQRFNAVLIEDRCHSLPSPMDFSADLIGDYAIYSVRKFLPVPDGGMLVCRASALPLPGADASLSWRAYSKFFLRHIGKMLFYSGVYHPYALQQQRKKVDGWFAREASRSALADITSDRSSAYESPLRRASPYLTKWLDGHNLSTVINKHRHHYQQMAALLPPDIVCQPRHDSSNANGVPVAFPIIDSSRTLDLVERLRALGIGAYAWPGNDLPMEVRGHYPQAERLARHLVMLPIHYDLTEDDLSYVAAVVHEEMKKVKQGSEGLCR